jgi:membrane-associated protein
MSEDWVLALTGSVWLFPALFALTVGDAFLVVLPSEIAVAALAALWASTGSPSLAGIIVVAAIAAVVGDSICYAIGRNIGTDRWRWQRQPRVARALRRAESLMRDRAAFLVFTARYIPYARIAVNLTAGSTGYPYRRFLPLSSVAGVTWALYHSLVGAFFGMWLSEQPILAIAITVAGAMTIGFIVDFVMRRLARPRTRRAS